MVPKNMPQPWPAAAARSGMASVIAQIITQPISDDHSTAETMPRGTEWAARTGLLGGVGRGVVAGDGVDRQQQAEQEQVAHVVRIAGTRCRPPRPSSW